MTFRKADGTPHPMRLRSEEERKAWRHLAYSKPPKTNRRHRITDEQRAGHRRAKKTRHTLEKVKRVPLWARTPEQRRAIAAIYAEAALLTASTGIKHEVDHTYPLRGKTVSGLHVAENLRVVTAAVNLAKGNRYPAEITSS